MANITIAFLNELEKVIVEAAQKQKDSLLEFYKTDIDASVLALVTARYEELGILHDVEKLELLKQKEEKLKALMNEVDKLVAKVGDRISNKLNPNGGTSNGYWTPIRRAENNMQSIVVKTTRQVIAKHPVLADKVEKLDDIIKNTRQRMIIAGSDVEIRTAFTGFMETIKQIADS